MSKPTWSVLLIRPHVSGDELKITSGLTLIRVRLWRLFGLFRSDLFAS